MPEMWVQSLGQGDSLEKKIATHSSILVWEIPRTEKPSRPQSMGLQRVEHDLQLSNKDWASHLALCQCPLNVYSLFIKHVFLECPQHTRCHFGYYKFLLLFSCSVVSYSFVTPTTIAHQAPLSMEFPRQEYWSALPLPLQGNLPDPDTISHVSYIAGRFFTTDYMRSLQFSHSHVSDSLWPHGLQLDWKKHKLESRLPGEISITSDMQMTPPLWQKIRRN